MTGNMKSAALAVILFAGSAFAHHSFTAEFDQNKPIKLSGKITEMKWSNPHGWIYVDVTGPDGKVVTGRSRPEEPTRCTDADGEKKTFPSAKSSSLKAGKRATERRPQTSTASPSKTAAACLPAHPTHPSPSSRELQGRTRNSEIKFAKLVIAVAYPHIYQCVYTLLTRLHD